MQLKVPKERLAHIWTLAYLGGAIIAFRLADIQILRHDYYRNAAERNRTQIIYQTAPRGRIMTADSVTVAANQPSFNLIYLPGGRNDPAYMRRLADDFSSRLGVTSVEVQKKLQNAFQRGRPVKLASLCDTYSMDAATMTRRWQRVRERMRALESQAMQAADDALVVAGLVE